MNQTDAGMKRSMSYLFGGLLAVSVGIIFLANMIVY